MYAGCLWWREVVAQARAEYPAVPIEAILDCADGAGQAMAAVRAGVVRLVLWRTAPGWAPVSQIARRQGGFVLPAAPAALDLAASGAMRQLPVWLQVRSAIRDSGGGLG